MKFGVVQFPGSNCDRDIYYVLKCLLKCEVSYLWHENTNLEGADVIILSGGFSFGDYLRCGAIARFSPIMAKVFSHAQTGGMVLGICNGFQILCETGLLPGLLTANVSGRFCCKPVHVRVEKNDTPFTRRFHAGQILQLPIAHGEGNYYADKETLRQLEENKQILLRYCNREGEIVSEANPNGSQNSIAAICNEKRNVLGIMPHPERATEFPLGSVDGLGVFESLLVSEKTVLA